MWDILWNSFQFHLVCILHLSVWCSLLESSKLKRTFWIFVTEFYYCWTSNDVTVQEHLRLNLVNEDTTAQCKSYLNPLFVSMPSMHLMLRRERDIKFWFQMKIFTPQKWEILKRMSFLMKKEKSHEFWINECWL